MATSQTSPLVSSFPFALAINSLISLRMCFLADGPMGMVLISVAVMIAFMMGRTLVLWMRDFHRRRNCPSSGTRKLKASDLHRRSRSSRKLLTSVKRRLVVTVGKTEPWSPSLVQLKSVALAQVCSWPRHFPGGICQEQRALL